jgi:alpha-amylase
MRTLLRLSTTAALLASLAASPAFAGVMMEGFYWNVPAGWYGVMASKAAELGDMGTGYGIDRIWFPPPSKGQSGPQSMGYDPHDYYDLGSFDQDGAVATRFGTQDELKAALSAYKDAGIATMADIVLNHRSGGKSEANPNAGGSTWTDFSDTASGKCQWHYNEFHPSTFEPSDEGSFAGMPDICHATGNTPGHAYYDLIHWGQWLRSSDNAGFDGGWRFDYVKGFHPWMAHDFWAATGSPFSVGEYWDANTGLLDGWVGAAGGGISVFDFPLYYTLQGICNDAGGTASLPDVFDAAKSYAAKNPLRAVTFAANHDTDGIITDKMLAYAFILTYQGYPDIFWKDYFDDGLARGGGAGTAGAGNGIVPLVWAREKLAGGSPRIAVLKSDDPQLIVYQSDGASADAPGYIVVINTNPSNWRGARVQTADAYLQNKTLKAYAWSSTVAGQNTAPDAQPCDAAGWTQVYAPPRGYAVFSAAGF